MQRLLDSIPRWLNYVLGVAGGAAGFLLAQAGDTPTSASMWILGAAGFFLGLFILPLIVVLADFSTQLLIGLVKLAIVLAVIAGIVYGFLWLIGT
jgi:hypothetical protein